MCLQSFICIVCADGYDRLSYMPIHATAPISPNTEPLSCPPMVYCSLELRIEVPKAPLYKGYFSTSSGFSSKRIPILCNMYSQIQKPLSDSLATIYRSVHNSTPSFSTSHTPVCWASELNAGYVLRALNNRSHVWHRSFQNRPPSQTQ